MGMQCMNSTRFGYYLYCLTGKKRRGIPQSNICGEKRKRAKNMNARENKYVEGSRMKKVIMMT